jgi:hypothetical protein
MWHVLRTSPEADPELVSTARELFRSTSRTVILSVGVICLVWITLSVVVLSDEALLRATPVLLLAMVACAVAALSRSTCCPGV